MDIKDGVLVYVDSKDLDLLKLNPDKFWEGVTKIGEYAFWDCKKKFNLNKYSRRCDRD